MNIYLTWSQRNSYDSTETKQET